MNDTAGQGVSRPCSQLAFSVEHSDDNTCISDKSERTMLCFIANLVKGIGVSAESGNPAVRGVLRSERKKERTILIWSS